MASFNFLLFCLLLLPSLSISLPEVTARTPATTTTVIVPEATPAVQVEKAAKFSTHSHPSPTTKSSHEEEKESKAQQGYRNEKFGMSDTLFLENGKYFYDADADKGYGLYAGIGLKGAKHYMHDSYNNEEANSYDREIKGENEEYDP